MSWFDSSRCEEGISWEMWETIVSNALAGLRGQAALADLALPQRRLTSGHLACDGDVCTVGALVAHTRAVRDGCDVSTVIANLSAGVRCWCGHSREQHNDDGCTENGRMDIRRTVCGCREYDPFDEDGFDRTRTAGMTAGLTGAVAWHLAWLNDEQFSRASPEQRFEQVLEWVRRARGTKTGVAA